MRLEQECSGAPTCTPIFEKIFEARVKVVAPHHGAGGKTTPSSTSISLLLRAKLPNYRVGCLVAQFWTCQAKEKLYLLFPPRQPQRASDSVCS